MSNAACSTQKGLLFMTLSCLFKSLFSVLSKKVMANNAKLNSFHLLFLRSVFMSLIAVAVLTVQYKKLVSASRTAVAIISGRSLLAMVSMSCLTFSLKTLNISDVYSLYFTYPAIIILLSSFLLKEHLTLPNLACLFICLLATILIIKPSFLFESASSSNNLLFVLVFISALIKAIEDVMLKSVGNKPHFLLTPVTYSLLGIFIFPLPLLASNSPFPSVSQTECLFIFTIATFSFLYQALMAAAIQQDKLSRVCMVNYFQVGLMFLADILLFDKPLFLENIAATFLIVTANVANSIMSK